MIKDYLGHELSEGDRVVFIDIHYPMEFTKGFVEHIDPDGWVEVSYGECVIGVRYRQPVSPMRIIKCD